jgi:hypothetical protein
MKPSLLELAELCEKASGRDLEIDAAIGELCGFEVTRRDPPFQTTCRRNFTAYFCDARVLVPVGFRWAIEGDRSGLCYAAIDRPDDPNGPVFEGQAAEPELALTAASLRALAAPRANTNKEQEQ